VSSVKKTMMSAIDPMTSTPPPGHLMRRKYVGKNYLWCNMYPRIMLSNRTFCTRAGKKCASAGQCTAAAPATPAVAQQLVGYPRPTGSGVRQRDHGEAVSMAR
jgi:hypothetical protein